MNNIYSVEILIKTILFYKSQKSIPRPSSVAVHATLGDFLDVMISRDVLGDELPEITNEDKLIKVNEDNTTMLINAGKSIVFAVTPETITMIVKKDPFRFKVLNVHNEFSDHGQCEVKGNVDDIYAVLNARIEEKSEGKKHVLEEAIHLLNKNGERTGIIELYVRITNFGNQLKTRFQVPEATSKNRNKYIFKNERCGEAFQIEKIGTTASPSLPNAPVIAESNLGGEQFNPVFITPFSEHASIMVSAFKMLAEEALEEAAESEIESVRPPPKVIDDNLLKYHETQITGETELTPAKIRALLCGNRWCPVAQQFRDLGMGPFSPIKSGLGAITGREPPLKTFGMSQMYGSMEEYGPFGLLRKRAETCPCMKDNQKLPKLGPCDCFDKTSSFDLKHQPCGYNICELGEKSPDKTGQCCLKEDSLGFIPGYVPPPKWHCGSKVCDTEGGKVEKPCSCAGSEETECSKAVSCNIDECPHAKEKEVDCRCQNRGRSRGGTDVKVNKKCQARIYNKGNNENFQPTIKNDERRKGQTAKSSEGRKNRKRARRKFSYIPDEYGTSEIFVNREFNKNQSLADSLVQSIVSNPRRLRLKAGMDIYGKECPRFLQNSQVPSFVSSAEDIRNSKAANVRSIIAEKSIKKDFMKIKILDLLKDISRKDHKCRIRLRAGSEDTTCGGKKCFLQNQSGGCGSDSCEFKGFAPAPTRCGADSCPMSEDLSKKRQPKMASQHLWPKKTPEFIPFFLRPQPRNTFPKRNPLPDLPGVPKPPNECCPDLIERCCEKETCWEECRDDKCTDSNPCWNKEQDKPFYGKISHSYGVPVPIFDSDVPICFGGSKPCGAPKQPVQVPLADPCVINLPSCLGGRTPCDMLARGGKYCPGCGGYIIDAKIELCTTCVKKPCHDPYYEEDANICCDCREKLADKKPGPAVEACRSCGGQIVEIGQRSEVPCPGCGGQIVVDQEIGSCVPCPGCGGQIIIEDASSIKRITRISMIPANTCDIECEVPTPPSVPCMGCGGKIVAAAPIYASSPLTRVPPNKSQNRDHPKGQDKQGVLCQVCAGQLIAEPPIYARSPLTGAPQTRSQSHDHPKDQDKQRVPCQGCGGQLITEPPIYASSPITRAPQVKTPLQVPSTGQDKQNVPCQGCGGQFVTGPPIYSSSPITRPPFQSKEPTGSYRDQTKGQDNQGVPCRGCGGKLVTEPPIYVSSPITRPSSEPKGQMGPLRGSSKSQGKLGVPCQGCGGQFVTEPPIYTSSPITRPPSQPNGQMDPYRRPFKDQHKPGAPCQGCGGQLVTEPSIYTSSPITRPPSQQKGQMDSNRGASKGQHKPAAPCQGCGGQLVTEPPIYASSPITRLLSQMEEQAPNRGPSKGQTPGGPYKSSGGQFVTDPPVFVSSPINRPPSKGYGASSQEPKPQTPCQGCGGQLVTEPPVFVSSPVMRLPKTPTVPGLPARYQGSSNNDDFCGLPPPPSFISAPLTRLLEHLRDMPAGIGELDCQSSTKPGGGPRQSAGGTNDCGGCGGNIVKDHPVFISSPIMRVTTEGNKCEEDLGGYPRGLGGIPKSGQPCGGCGGQLVTEQPVYVSAPITRIFEKSYEAKPREISYKPPQSFQSNPCNVCGGRMVTEQPVFVSAPVMPVPKKMPEESQVPGVCRGCGGQLIVEPPVYVSAPLTRLTKQATHKLCGRCLLEEKSPRMKTFQQPATQFTPFRNFRDLCQPGDFGRSILNNFGIGTPTPNDPYGLRSILTPTCEPESCRAGDIYPCTACLEDIAPEGSIPTCAFSPHAPKNPKYDPTCDVCSSSICPGADPCFEETGPCRNDLCPIADIHDLATDEYPLLVAHKITVENCGDPCCPYSDLGMLGDAFKQIAEKDVCGAPDCPFILPELPPLRCTCKDGTCYCCQEERRNEIFLEEEESVVEERIKGTGLAALKTHIDVMPTESMKNFLEMAQFTASCSRKTCGKLRVPVCPDCGGMSISGATCRNPEVPYDPKATMEKMMENFKKEKEREERRKERRERREKNQSKEDKERERLEKEREKEKEKEKEGRKQTGKVAMQMHHGRFIYKGGKRYPGIRVGHRFCSQFIKNVPAYMGWLWNLPEAGRLKKRSWWKPGELSKAMQERIRTRRQELGIPDPPELKVLSTKKKTKTRAYEESSESEDEVEPKPTLKIKKEKDGTYYITMHPLKDPKTLAPREDPYMNCTPMQFVIKPKKLIAPVLSASSSTLFSDEDFKGCNCLEKKEEVVSTSSESELDIEFTPPAGLIYPELFERKPNIVYTDTQYNEKDLEDPDLPVIYLAKKGKKKAKKL